MARDPSPRSDAERDEAGGEEGPGRTYLVCSTARKLAAGAPLEMWVALQTEVWLLVVWIPFTLVVTEAGRWLRDQFWDVAFVGRGESGRRDRGLENLIYRWQNGCKFLRRDN